MTKSTKVYMTRRGRKYLIERKPDGTFGKFIATKSSAKKASAKKSSAKSTTTKPTKRSYVSK